MKRVQAPIDAVEELVDQRLPRTKFFRLQNGDTKIVASTARIHYQDANGKLQDIDPALTQNQNGELVAAGVPFQFKLHSAGVGFDFVSSTKETISMSLLSLDSVPFANKNKKLTSTFSGNKITFSAVAPDLDIEFVVHGDGVRTNRILKSAAAPTAFTWDVSGAANAMDRISDTAFGKDNVNKTERGGVQRHLELQVTKTPNRVIERWTGKTVSVDRVTRVKSLSDERFFPVFIDPDVTDTITINLDDGWEHPIGTWRPVDFFGNNNWQLGGFVGGYETSGLRFDNIVIPHASTISLANLTINVRYYYYGPVIANIFGIAVNGDFASFDNSNPPSGMPATSSFKAISISSNGLKTYDVTSIVQEIVNQAGWASGDAIGFKIPKIASSSWALIEDSSLGGSNPALLEITLSGGGGGGGDPGGVAGPSAGNAGIINNPVAL